MPFVSAVLALVVGISSAPFGGWARSPFLKTGATLARLQVSVTTTSDWSGIEFSAGRVWAHKVLSKSSGLDVITTQRGFVLDSTAGTSATAVVNMVYEALPSVATLTVRLEKGSVGSTTVKVRNTSTIPFDVTTVFAGAGAGSKSATLARGVLFGRADPPLPRADARRLVLAAYYPWWAPGAYSNPELSDRPADRRFTTEADDVASMVQQARNNGIDGFVVSWVGEQENGAAFDLVLDAEEQSGGTASVYLEIQHAVAEPGADPSAAIVKRWIDEALERSDSPAFLRSGGVPVIFVFEMGRLGPAAWDWVLDQLAAAGTPVRLVGDAQSENYLPVSWGVHNYNPNSSTIPELTVWNRAFSLKTKLLDSASPADHLFMATVSPGYDDQAARGTTNPVVPRGSLGERYEGTWNAAFAAVAEWVLVTSWNEWIEGTHVEPGEETGDLALRQTAAFAATFHGLMPPRVGSRTPSRR